MTIQEEFNVLKRIIECKKNKPNHLEAIRNMIDIFQRKHGICRLSNVLNELQTELIKRV
jgi:hypothetical protein